MAIRLDLATKLSIMETLSAQLRSGENWIEVPWLVAHNRSNHPGSLVLCGRCGQALGFLSVVRRLKITSAALFGEAAQSLDLESLPETFSFSSSDLLRERPKERVGEWKQGYLTEKLTEEQETEAEENRRLLSMTGDIQEGEDEWLLVLPPRFDCFEDGTFGERDAPLREHTHFQQRLSHLRIPINLFHEEIALYKEALKDPSSLPYPDLVSKRLKHLQDDLVEAYRSYRQAESNGDDYPTDLYCVDTPEVNLAEGIIIICPQCNSNNSLIVIKEAKM